MHVVHRRLEHAPQAQLARRTSSSISASRRALSGPTTVWSSSSPSVIRTVTSPSSLAVDPFEQRVERDLQVLERLERQVEANGETAEDEMRDVLKVGLARKGERDLVSHRGGA